MLVRAASAFVTSAVRGLLGDPCGLGLAYREKVPEPVRLLVQRLFVHLEDGGPYSSHGTDNARAKGAHGGWADDIFAGVGRGGSCSGRHARLLVYLPDYQGKQGKVDGF